MLGSLTAVRISRRVRLEQQENYKKHKYSKGARSIHRKEKEFQNPGLKTTPSIFFIRKFAIPVNASMNQANDRAFHDESSPPRYAMICLAI